MHEWLLAEHGGAPGLLDEGNLDASLASPRNHPAHANPDVFDIAAIYAPSPTRNPPFQDGNKRIAFVIAGVFLELNGFRLEAPERDAYHAMMALSTRGMDEVEFAGWMRANARKFRRGGERAASTAAPARKRGGTAVSRMRRPR